MSTYNANVICTACSDVLERGRRLFSRDHECILSLHHSHIAHLQAAAELSCRFCAPFWDQFTPEWQSWLLESDALSAEYVFASDMPDIGDQSPEADRVRMSDLEHSATTCTVFPNTDWFESEYEENIIFAISITTTRMEKMPAGDPLRYSQGFFVLLPIGDPEQQLISSYQSGANPSACAPGTDSSESWDWAQTWINSCSTSHTRCNEHRDASWHPTRLLEFSHTEDKFQIIETRKTDCTGPYMTLSHRWGSSQPRTLNKATRAALYAGMPITDLPLAFQHAVDICRRLKIRYLWIDCLCIMQDRDDLSDWIREASLMHKVYTHSYLNVSALRCPDSSHGIFAARDTSLLGEARVVTRLNGLYYGDSEREFRVINVRFWLNELQHEPLNLRAWVLQERLLAPRVLHFGRHQLLWECQELEASESYPHGLPPVMSKNLNAWSKKLSPAMFVDGLRAERFQSLPELAPYHYWARIVEAYAKCRLTESSDKLIALAGIAKYMRSHYLDDEYVAGMWRRHLALELTWHVEDQEQSNGKGAQRVSPYRAPTFSWASVEGIIEPMRPDQDRALIEIIDVVLDLATEDVTGLLRGGHLTLRCHLQRISLRPNPYVPRLYNVDINGTEAAELGERSEWEKQRPLIKLDEHEDYLNPLSQEPDTLFCVPARISPDASFFDSLLLRLISAETGTYARFGLLRSFLSPSEPPSPAESHVRAVLQSHSPDESRFPCITHAPGATPHTIRII